MPRSASPAVECAGPSSPGEQLPGEELLPATLCAVRGCPARPEYLELCFETGEGPWTWCFPRPARRLRRPPRPVALTLGRYGVIARAQAAGGQLGPALGPAVALPMIVAGAQVAVERRLAAAGR